LAADRLTDARWSASPTSAPGWSPKDWHGETCANDKRGGFVHLTDDSFSSLERAAHDHVTVKRDCLIDDVESTERDDRPRVLIANRIADPAHERALSHLWWGYLLERCATKRVIPDGGERPPFLRRRSGGLKLEEA
jgi:hypothetical protein